MLLQILLLLLDLPPNHLALIQTPLIWLQQHHPNLLLLQLHRRHLDVLQDLLVSF